MWTFLQNTLPNFFADDLACVIGGRLGVNYTLQCLDLEAKLKTFFDYLEFYAILSLQPLNFDKTEAMWSSRAIGNPRFELWMGQHKISWVKHFRYLGYHLTGKLGWSHMLQEYKRKIRQRVAIVKSCAIGGATSQQLRKIVFCAFVKPIFAWLFSIYPLLTNCQRDELSHFYFTCLKRTVGALRWNDILFSSLFNEKTLENLCTKYWEKYKAHLTRSMDGVFLFEHTVMNAYREQWLRKEFAIRNIYRSQRFKPFIPSVEKGLAWLEENARDSTPHISAEELELLASFPESFM